MVVAVGKREVSINICLVFTQLSKSVVGANYV